MLCCQCLYELMAGWHGTSAPPVPLCLPTHTLGMEGTGLARGPVWQAVRGL